MISAHNQVKCHFCGNFFISEGVYKRLLEKPTRRAMCSDCAKKEKVGPYGENEP